MSRFRLVTLGTALVVALFAGTAAEASAVSYLVSGEFTWNDGMGSQTSSTYDNGLGAVIAFTPPPSNGLDLFPSNAGFGSFDTTGTAGLTDVNATFRLTIYQSDPAFDTLYLDGVLSGKLGGTGGSTAHILFTTLTAVSTTSGGVVTYSIVNGSQGILGRININAPDAGPMSSIEAIVDFQAVPEPATVVMLGLAAPVALIYGARRRRAA